MSFGNVQSTKHVLHHENRNNSNSALKITEEINGATKIEHEDDGNSNEKNKIYLLNGKRDVVVPDRPDMHY